MIFVDSNVPMYLVGAPHPHKVDAQRILEALVVAGERLVTDVEVMQEILHRYVAISRRDSIRPAIDCLVGVVDAMFSIERPDVERATDIVLEFERLSARDALHLAVMERHDVTRILSFDRGFDSFPGIVRLSR